jgi:hypothetical protein
MIAGYNISNFALRKSEWPIMVIFTILLIGASGCQKHEYSLPVDFELRFTIAETPVMEGRLIVRSIALNLGYIEIEGRRAVGGICFYEQKVI